MSKTQPVNVSSSRSILGGEERRRTMTEPINLQVAIERYLDDLKEAEPSRVRTRRSHLRLVVRIVGSKSPVRLLLVDYEDIVSQIRQLAPARGSHTAI